MKFGEKVAKQDGYILPEQYNLGFNLKPEDYSDIGQAVVLAREYNGNLRYSSSTGYLVYNGSFWEESDPLSQAVAQELTTRQLDEAEVEIKKDLRKWSRMVLLKFSHGWVLKKRQRQCCLRKIESFEITFEVTPAYGSSYEDNLRTGRS